jgi:hypothetical protein
MSAGYRILVCLLIAHIHLFGQKDCGYRIDTARILKDRNLDSLLVGLRMEDFQIFNNKKKIPAAIMQQLVCLSRDGFTLANPNEDYQSGCIISKKLPARQLIAFGRSENFFIIDYLRGGGGTYTTLIILKLKDERIIDLWMGYGPPRLASKEDAIRYIITNRYDKNLGLHGFVSI